MHRSLFFGGKLRVTYRNDFECYIIPLLCVYVGGGVLGSHLCSFFVIINCHIVEAIKIER